MLMYNGGWDVVTAATGLGTATDRECKLWESLLAAPATVIGQRKLPGLAAFFLAVIFLLALFVTACVCLQPHA